MSASSGDTAPGLPTARHSGTCPSEFFLDLLRAFLRGNGFYVLSMVLVVFGCHRHVHSTVTSGPDAEFSRTLLSLSILQAYELLVIATAALVVRRLRILGDAGTLLLIEAALLLDPTFFANSFLTMPGQQGVTVNAVCLALVPLKLLVLQGLIGLRLSGRMWAGFCVAAAVVYLAPWPLDRRDMPFLSLYGYYYFVGALTALAAVILPPVGKALRFREHPVAHENGPDGEFVSPTQSRWLPRALILLPVLVTAAHYIETARVYTLAFYPANGAPLVLAVAVLVVANGRRGSSEPLRRLATDLLAVLGLVLSLPAVNMPSSYDRMRPVWALPDFISSPWPLVVAGGGVILIYVYYWLYLRDPAAVRRLVVLAAGGIVAATWKSGLPGLVLEALRSAGAAVGRGISMALQVIGSGIGWTLSLLASMVRWTLLLAYHHPDAALLVLLVLAVLGARRRPGFGTWLFTGIVALLLVFRQLPGGAAPHAVEFMEMVIVLALALSHRFRPLEERGPRLVCAVLVCFAASLRFHASPGAVTGGMMLFQILLLLAAARIVHERGYLVIAAFQVLSCLIPVAQYVRLHVQPAAIMVGAGLLLFAVAVYVSFHKERLLSRLQPRTVPPPLPPEVSAAE